MRKGVMLLLGVALAAGASVAQAQGKPATSPKGGKEHPMGAMAHGSMASEHEQMMTLQRRAIAAAQAAEGMSHAQKLNLPGVRREATRARDDLGAVLKHMDRVESTATAEQKQHMAAVRTHEQEALKHAQELVTAANAARPDAGAISTHARAVLEHAREAEKLADDHRAAGRSPAAGWTAKPGKGKVAAKTAAPPKK